MSKELEAYDIVFNSFNNCTCQDGRFPIRSALDTIYQALKRNEPMKPRTKTYTNGFFKLRACSVCDTTIEKEFVYCPCCGQKLDWSDDK